MADSDALRAQRYRAHRQGQHHLCKHPLARVTAPEVAALTATGPIDRDASLRALAARLEAAHVADPANAAVARELRMTLTTLIGLPGEDDPDPLAELWASLPPS